MGKAGSRKREGHTECKETMLTFISAITTASLVWPGVLSLEFDPCAFMNVWAPAVRALVLTNPWKRMTLNHWWNQLFMATAFLNVRVHCQWCCIWFPFAIVTHYDKLNIIKQQKLIFLQFRRWEAWNGFCKAKMQMLAILCFSSGEFSLPFPVSRGCQYSLAYGFCLTVF